GQPLPKEARPVVEEMARREGRVLIRLSPQWTVYTPPVHLYAGDDGSKMRHGLAQRLPWRVCIAHGAVNLGIGREELIEVLMQTACYAGLPAAVAALNAAAVSLEEN